MATETRKRDTADESRKTGISAGNGGEMGDDGHIAPGGELASMPGGPAPSQDRSQNEKLQKEATAGSSGR